MAMHAFDVLGDAVRRRILELLAEGEHASGAVVEVIAREFGITQSAVSQHLKVLRDNGFATVRTEGTRRLYAVAPAPFAEVDHWLDRFRHFWDQPLEALATEIARGKRERKRAGKRAEVLGAEEQRADERSRLRADGTGRRRRS
jgi:DNA-binding transcriptional ArsR family regulator